jgi:transcriptional regulator with XRE-family HTH domain
MASTTNSGARQVDDLLSNHKRPLVQALMIGLPLLCISGSPATTTTNSITTVLSALSSAPAGGLATGAGVDLVRGRVAQGQTERVRKIYHRSGLSWDELGRVLGVSRRTIHNWANGFRMSSRHVVLLGQFENLLDRYDANGPQSVRVSLLTPDADGVSPYTAFLREASPAPLPGQLTVQDLLGTMPSV